MQLPVRIAFRHMPHSDAIESYARERAAKLDTFFDRIVGGQVTIESTHKHRHTGRQYRVMVDLTVPGSELVVSHAPGDSVANQDVYAAIDAAFDQASRRLEDYARRIRGDVKTHEPARRDAVVGKLWTYEGFGFLTTPDGGEIYFHRNSVLDHAFDRLKVGSKVRFIEEMGDKGPQASSVSLVG